MRYSLAMCFVQRISDGDAYLQRLFDRKRTAREPLCKRFALQILHDQEVRGALTSDVIQSADVRMIQSSDGLRFALEPAPELGVFREMNGQYLYRDRTIQARVDCLIHLAHSAGPE